MKKSILLVISFILHFSCSFGQDIKDQFEKIEITSDSLYYSHKENNFKKNQYDRLQKLKNKIVLHYTDTSSTLYKAALSKKYAVDALSLNYSMHHIEAISQSKKALALAETLAKRDLYFEGHIHQALFHQYSLVANWEKTLYHAKKAKEVFSRTLVFNHEKLAFAEFNLGQAIGWLEGDEKEGIRYNKKAVELIISNKGEFNEDAAIYEHHLALKYGFIGFYAKELRSYENVIKRWEAIESDSLDMSYLSIAYGSISVCYVNHGDFDMAEKYLIKKENLVNKYQKRATKWSNEIFKGRIQVSIWHNRAKLALAKKDTLKALKYNAKILDFINKFDFNDADNNPHNLPNAYFFVNLNKIKALEFRAGILINDNPLRAMDLLSEALALEPEESHPLTTLGIKLNLLKLHKHKKEYTQATNKLNGWLVNANEKKGIYIQLFLLAQKANLALLQDDIELMDKEYSLVFKKAQQDTLRAIPLAKLNFKDFKPYSEQRYINLLLQASKDYKEAYLKTKHKKYQTIAHNLSLLCSVIFSESYLFSESNNNVHEIRSQINDLVLSTSIQLKESVVLDDIVEKLEDSNSKIHWKKFLSSNQKKHLNIPDSILELESDLNNELHFYRKKIITSNDKKDKLNRIKKEKIFDIENKLRDIELFFQKNYPSYYNQTQKSFDLSFLKSQLTEQQTVLKYLFSSDSVYVFAITKSNTQLFSLGSKSELTNQIITFAASFSKPNSNYHKLASEVYETFLKPRGLELIPNQELIIVLDDVLNYVPFEGLITPKGDYLVEKFNISYATSMALWSEQMQAKKSSFKKMGVFAPTYGNLLVENVKRNDSTFLMGAEREGLDISKLFKSDAYLGDHASKQVFIEKANQYGVLHLAMHSTINNTHSRFSNLAFSPNQKDNKLFVSELYNISLNADLAVLSACNTGAGVIKNGEGVQSISRAFTYAGVSSTVVSLWSVPDKETAQIMVAFYTYLKEGKPKNKALQLAKLDYLASTDDESLRHPFYWAGFILSGNVDPISEPSTNYIYTTILILILLFSIFFLRKRLTSVKFLRQTRN